MAFFLASLAERFFQFTKTTCNTLRLVPFTLNSDGKMIEGSRTQKLIHYFIVVTSSSWWIYRGYICWRLLQAGEMKLRSFLCLAIFLSCFSPWMYSFLMTVKGKETRDLINSWTSILACIPRIPPDRHGSIFHQNTTLTLQAIMITGVCFISPFYVSAITILFESLPVYWVVLAEDLQLISQRSATKYASWRWTLALLELLTSFRCCLQPCSPTTFTWALQ